MTQDFSSLVGGLAPGEQIAGYEIQEQIGRGGMAVVYRALDLRLGRPVALKVLAPHLIEDEAFRQRFIRESRAAAGVDHPHIIPVFDAGEADGVLFIAMRYVSFGDVRMLIDREGRLSAARTLAITTQVASALDAAHANGLVHRDVKPGNILLGEAGKTGQDHVYLSDFGLSKRSLAASTLTAAGQFMGTLDYVSPEQIQGHPADGRADQYGLACTAVEMLTGSPPFRRDESMALLWAQLEAPPPPLTLRRPDLPPAVDSVMGRAMAKAPADRYPTCTAFASALRTACEVGLASPRGPAQVPPQAPRTAGADRPLARPVPATKLQWSPTRPRAATDQVAQPSPAPRRNFRWVAGVVVVIAAIAVLGAFGYRLMHNHNAAAPPRRPTTTGAAAVHIDPTATVQRYIAAINDQNYQEAWQLVRKKGSFAGFSAGFAGTEHDTLTIQSVKGNVVTVQLAAAQTNGTVKNYQGYYVVMNGVITSSDIQPTN